MSHIKVVEEETLPGEMPIANQVKSEIERVNRIFLSAAELMDWNIDYARTKVIEKGLVPPGINPDHLPLRKLIDLLANG